MCASFKHTDECKLDCSICYVMNVIAVYNIPKALFYELFTSDDNVPQLCSSSAFSHCGTPSHTNCFSIQKLEGHLKKSFGHSNSSEKKIKDICHWHKINQIKRANLRFTTSAYMPQKLTT